MTRENRRANWAKLVQEQNGSGLNAAACCRQKELNEKAFRLLDCAGLQIPVHCVAGTGRAHKADTRPLRGGHKYLPTIPTNPLRGQEGRQQSRKGNCYDNAVIENFFGLVKTEFFEHRNFKSAEEFQKGLIAYLDYYNNDRIKVKLNGLSPVAYRTQSIVFT